MGQSARDYEGYKIDWLIKSDLTVSKLKRYGIHTSVKSIKEKCGHAITGWVRTGGQGHFQRTLCYDINKLKNVLKGK